LRRFETDNPTGQAPEGSVIVIYVGSVSGG